MADCDTCAGLRLAVADLIQTIENLLEANKDYADSGKTLLPPIYAKGLISTLKEIRAGLDGLEGLSSAPIPPPRTPEQRARARELEQELSTFPLDVAQIIRCATRRAADRFLAEKVSHAKNIIGKISPENVKKLLAGE